MITRRDFVKIVAAGGIGTLSLPLISFNQASNFRFAQLKYYGAWDPRPRAFNRLMTWLDLRSSVKTSSERKILEIGNPELFHYPFLYMAGAEGFEPFGEEERKRLRRFIKFGGTLLIDDASGEEDSPFDSQIKEEFKNILPEFSFTRIPSDHVIFKSFYLLHSPSGRKVVRPYLEGITFSDEDRTSLIYSRNDLGGAWSEDEFGKWQYECIPGGEAQRELAFRLGINIIIYALTGNYKKDQIHSPFIKRREMSF